MPNPRYLTEDGEATVELLRKLSLAKRVYYVGLNRFCEKEVLDRKQLATIKAVFLIGSHAEETSWDNSTSDLDLKLINPDAIPENLWRYKREVLDPTLCNPDTRKRDWIDLFFAREEYQVLHPRWNLTKYWVQDI